MAFRIHDDGVSLCPCDLHSLPDVCGDASWPDHRVYKTAVQRNWSLDSPAPGTAEPIPEPASRLRPVTAKFAEVHVVEEFWRSAFCRVDVQCGFGNAAE